MTIAFLCGDFSDSVCCQQSPLVLKYPLLLPITSLNIDWFLKFFHQQTPQWLCNNMFIKYPITP